MCTEFTKVEASTREVFYDTLLMLWDQHWEKEFQQEFLAWRYGRRTDGETLVAMSGSKCIGVIDSFIRPYRRHEVLVREPCDWYWLPGNRGVGMQLLRFLIAQGEPLLAVGRSKGTMAIAPRMNWTRLLDTHHFILPLTARRVTGAIRAKGLGTDRSRCTSRVGYAFGQIPLQDVDGEVEDLAPEDWPGEEWPNVVEGGGYAVAPILTKSYVQWLSSGRLRSARSSASRSGKKRACRAHDLPHRSEQGRAQGQAHPPAVIRTEHEDAAVDDRRECLSGGPARSRERPLQVVMPDYQRSARVPPLPSHRERGRDGEIQWHAPIPFGPVNVTFLRGDDVMIPSLIAE